MTSFKLLRPTQAVLAGACVHVSNVVVLSLGSPVGHGKVEGVVSGRLGLGSNGPRQ